jgi:hypothetical protein
VSLARAFGIVGAAGLIRYRAKIDDPKDAGVMLSTLAIGLASGVGLYFLAIFTSLFILLCLWIIESFEPEATKLFHLKIALKDVKDVDRLRAELEALMRRARLMYDLRAASPEELLYEVKLPYERKTEKLSMAIMRLDPESNIAVEWDEKKEEVGGQGRGQGQGQGRGSGSGSSVRVGSLVIAELQRDTGTLLAQESHDILQFVFRRRRDPAVDRPDGRLHLRSCGP